MIILNMFYYSVIEVAHQFSVSVSIKFLTKFFSFLIIFQLSFLPNLLVPVSFQFQMNFQFQLSFLPNCSASVSFQFLIIFRFTFYLSFITFFSFSYDSFSFHFSVLAVFFINLFQIQHHFSLCTFLRFKYISVFILFSGFFSST